MVQFDATNLQQVHVSMAIKSFVVLEYHMIQFTPSEKPDYTWRHSMQYKVYWDTRQIVVQLTSAVVDDKAEDPERKLSEIVTLTTFDIENMTDYIIGDELHIPNIFLIFMTEIATSSTRGVMYDRHRGTPLGREVMPLAAANFPDQPGAYIYNIKPNQTATVK